MVDFRILLHRKEIESDDPTISDLMFRYSLFKAINIEEYRLSIQGNEGAYCSPREAIDVFGYDTMEIAVIFTKNNNFVDLPNEDKFKDLNVCKYHDGSVAGYVPICDIQELYERLVILTRKYKIRKLL